MSLDIGTVARRRHMVTIILRAGVLLWVVYAVLALLDRFLSQFEGFLSSGVGPIVFELLIPLAIRLAVVGAVLLLERRLVSWLVPLAPKDNSCPRCGYALKDLKSPICPECGTQIRAGA